MRKEVGVYLSVGALVVLGIFIAYLLNVSLTGFAIFQQGTQGDFDQGTYSNTTYSNGAVALDVNQTSGTYTSKVFDAGSSAQWNNLTWQGNNSLTFEVRGCATNNCSTESFVAATPGNLNITAQYFQYRTTFSDPNASSGLVLTGVSLDYTLISAPPAPINQTAVTISQPSGEKSSNTGVPINVSVMGVNTTCTYTVLDATDLATIQSNSTLSSCSNTTFNLGAGEGSYTFRIYVSGSNGSVMKDSNFSINLPNSQTPEEEVEEEPSQIMVPVIPVVPPTQTVVPAVSITAADIAALTLAPGKSGTSVVRVTNIGSEPVSACVVKATGDFASWVAASDSSQNLNSGDAKDFTLTTTVPGNLTDGARVIGVSVECAETATSKEFTVNVLNPKFLFEIISAERTGDKRLRVVYAIKELIGIRQNVTLSFKLADGVGTPLGNASASRNLSANASGDWSVNIPINASLNGTYVLTSTAASEVYTSTVTQDVEVTENTGGILGGFAIFEGLGTGGSIVVIVVVVALGVLLLVARTMRKSGKTLLGVLSESGNK